MIGLDELPTAASELSRCVGIDRHRHGPRGLVASSLTGGGNARLPALLAGLPLLTARHRGDRDAPALRVDLTTIECSRLRFQVLRRLSRFFSLDRLIDRRVEPSFTALASVASTKRERRRHRFITRRRLDEMLILSAGTDRLGREGIP